MSLNPIRLKTFLVIGFLFVGGPSYAAIESSSNYGSDIDDIAKKDPPIPDPLQKTPLDNRLGTKGDKLKKGEWVAAPIPNYDPSQGWGLVLMAQKIFEHEENVKPSMAVGAIFGTEKKSYGGIAGYVGRLHEDRCALMFLVVMPK